MRDCIKKAEATGGQISDLLLARRIDFLPFFTVDADDLLRYSG